MTNYSKERLLNNIDYLLKIKNIKISELENYMGVSVGYLSRLKNSDNPESCPSIDSLSKIAEKLDSSIISLLFCNYAELTETELYLINKIEKIIDKTKDGLIKWERIKQHDFVNYDYDINEIYEDYYNSSKVTKSLFLDQYVTVHNDVYYFNTKDREYLLIPISFEKNVQYEFYLVVNERFCKRILCSQNGGKSGIFEIMDNLYKIAEFSSKQVKIDKEVKESLDDLFSD